MAKVRQDAWSHENDLLLAETVLRHIREGSTQLNAFEEVGDKLNRTSAACGFRWNAEVRQRYQSAIELAKRQRKEKKRAMAKQSQKWKKPAISLSSDIDSGTGSENPPVITIDTVIHFLKELKKEYQVSNQSKTTLEQFQKENETLKQKISELEKELKVKEKELTTMREDYQTFIQIMERARKMTVFEDHGTMKAPTFRMDKNGNLEQVANSTN